MLKKDFRLLENETGLTQVSKLVELIKMQRGHSNSLLYMNDETLFLGGINKRIPISTGLLEDENGINTASGIDMILWQYCTGTWQSLSTC
jgi:hypothetical protein